MKNLSSVEIEKWRSKQSRKNWKNWPVLWSLVRLIPSSLLSLSKGRLFLLKEMPKNSVCAEIGTFKGYFAEKILYFTNPKKLHLIDPWTDLKYDATPNEGENRYQNVLELLNREINFGQVLIHRGYSHEVCSNFEDNYFDWIYIDGSHEYEFVKKDLEIYYPKIKVGGFITGDDYMEGPWFKGGGVKRAVDEFIATKLVKVIKIKNRQFILKK
ncbi:MAG: class I SAM-dependent methyltransferase [Thioploca sp.]|nr:class I SAM-dependent methyltransferase [Thioploca sp.]